MKKRTFAVALIICLVAIIGFGSLAYFQASKNLTNYFAVAGVADPTDPDATIDPDDLFSIRLDEKNLDIMTGTARTEEGNVYKDILPGDKLEKDPTVTNTGKYDAWVRVKVTVTDAADWMEVCAKDHNKIADLSTIFIGFDDTKWDREIAEDVIDTVNDTITYTYYYKDEVAPGEKVTLFTHVIIPETLTVDDMAALATFQLQITGEAIQAANTGATAQEAFANFK